MGTEVTRETLPLAGRREKADSESCPLTFTHMAMQQAHTRTSAHMHVWSFSQNKEPVDEALCIHLVLFTVEHLSRVPCVPVV